MNESIFWKFFQIWAKIGSNLKKNLEKIRWFCSKFGAKLVQSVYECMGNFFLKNLYLYGSTFKFLSGTSYQNQTWVPLLGSEGNNNDSNNDIF